MATEPDDAAAGTTAAGTTAARTTAAETPAAGTGDPPAAPRYRLWWSFLGGLATVGLCAGAVLLVRSGEPAATPSVRVPDVVVHAPVSSEPGQPATRLQFRSGRYTATGHYLTPGGNESLGVSLDVQGDTVTAFAVQVRATSPTARQFQEQFRTTIAGQIIGKPLSTLSVSRVSGASLTSLGFDDALTRLKQEAKK